MSALGLLNVEMESAAILAVARLHGLRAGMICSVSANFVSGDVEYHREGPDPRLARGWDDSIAVALEAIHRLEQQQ
jgi:uridine phosphorylase